MANRDVILFKSKANRNIMNSKFTFRAIVRYSIIFVMTSLIGFLLFSLGDLKNVSSDFLKYAKDNVQILFSIILIINIGVMAIKMNQTSFNASSLNLFMVLICIGYAAFITIHLKDYHVKEFKEFAKTSYIYITPIVSFLTLWYIVSAFVERKTRPQLSKYMIWRSISAINVQAISWLGYIFLYKFTSIINTSHDTFDKENPLHLMLVVSAALMALGEIAQTILRMIKYKKALSKEEILKSISLAIVFMTTIPLSAWFIYNYIVVPDNTEEYLFAIADVLVVIFGLWITLLKKGRLSSPVISTTIYSLSIVMIWTNKFAFDSFKLFDIRQVWEISVSLIAMSIIVIFMFIKNNPASLSQSLSQIFFALLITAFILGDSVITAFPTSRDTINASLSISVGMTWDEALNITVLTSSVGLAFTATSAWYKVQAKINRNLSVKLRKGGKHA